MVLYGHIVYFLRTEIAMRRALQGDRTLTPERLVSGPVSHRKLVPPWSPV